MPYQRILPRDLFNEAKLLKCLGQLALLIHDGDAHPLVVHHAHSDGPFLIDQNLSDGSTFCHNLVFAIDARRVELSSSLNCRSPYPLCFYDEEYGEGAVFNDDGTLTDEFKEVILEGYANGQKTTDNDGGAPAQRQIDASAEDPSSPWTSDHLPR